MQTVNTESTVKDGATREDAIRFLANDVRDNGLDPAGFDLGAMADDLYESQETWDFTGAAADDLASLLEYHTPAVPVRLPSAEHPMKELTEAEFASQFTVVPGRLGDPVREALPKGVGVDSRHVWSVVEGDVGGDLYLAPGVHSVNRLGFVMTVEPWPFDVDSAEWDVRSS